MSKKYKENLIYIPTDLVGNAIVDNIRKSFDLGTKLKPDVKLATLNQILFGGDSEIKFNKVASSRSAKIYDFRIENFAGDKALQQKKKELENQGKSQTTIAGILFFEILNSVAELVAKPIINKDMFFDTSFPGGRAIDNTFFLPLDATEQEKNDSKLDENIPYYYYNIRSDFTKYVKNDPFGRFQGNTSTNSDIVPSMYRLIESDFLEPDGKTLNDIGDKVNYSLFESTNWNHVVF